jgi:predicted phosphodiesterase
MKLRILSDLHLRHHADHGDSFQAEIQPGSPDEVLVLAGDINDSAGDQDHLRKRFRLFCEKWRKVIVVLGNHEYYSYAPDRVHEVMARMVEQFPQIVWLNNNSVEVEGVHFYGGTLWFPFDSRGKPYESWLSDFSLIKGFRQWVYGEHDKFIDGLRKVPEGAVVVSHHLPSWDSVHEKYRWGEAAHLNRFFVGDVHAILMNRKPKLWIHGHTHEAMDYKIGPTRVVCNPFGYPREPKNQFREQFVVDTDEAPPGAEAP